jgi:hypothetical protein
MAWWYHVKVLFVDLKETIEWNILVRWIKLKISLPAFFFFFALLDNLCVRCTRCHSIWRTAGLFFLIFSTFVFSLPIPLKIRVCICFPFRCRKRKTYSWKENGFQLITIICTRKTLDSSFNTRVHRLYCDFAWIFIYFLSFSSNTTLFVYSFF